MAQSRTEHRSGLREVLRQIGVTAGGLLVALAACLAVLILVGEATRS